jgi:hypothetical protein
MNWMIHVKKIISFFVLIVVIVTVWLGASFYSARTTGNYIKSLPELYKQNDAMHFKMIEHQQSAFSSTGKFEIRFPNLTPIFSDAPSVIGLVVQYNISNLLLPDSAGRFEWKVTGDDTIDPMLKKLFGQGPTLHGKGHIGYSGQRQSSVELSELLFKDAETSLKMARLHGVALWENQKLNLKLHSDRLITRTENASTDLRGMSIDIKLTDRMLGLGTYIFGIDQGSNASSSFKEMKLTKTVSLDKDRFNLLIAHTMKQFTSGKFKLSDLELDFALSGWDKDSVMSLSTLSREIKYTGNLTSQERMKLSSALSDLFDKGFSIALPRVVATLNDGKLEGDIKIDVLKSETKNITFSSAQRLRANGQLSITGKGGLDKDLQATALMLGLAVKTPEGLKISFDLANGITKLNGKTSNEKDNLKFLDGIINSALKP